MDDFQPGDLAVYGEDGGRNLVRILSNTSTADEYQYRLKVVGHVMGPPLPIGEEFDVMQKRQGGWGGMWHMSTVAEFRGRHPGWQPKVEVAP